MVVSLRWKFIAISILKIVVSFTLASVVLMHFEEQSIHGRIDRTLSIQAEMMEINSQAALAFHDEKTATEVLGSLRADCSIIGAWIYDQGGKLFASYCKEEAVPPELPKQEGLVHEPDLFKITRKIKLSGNPIGTVVIVSNLSVVSSMMRRYIVVMLFTMCLACFVATLISIGLQRGILGRISKLAQCVNSISLEERYEVEIESGTMDEIGQLISGFRHMVGVVRAREFQVQEKTNELENLNRELEKRVSERTIQLEASNSELEAFSYSVAHDLRAPLRHIDGFVDLLSRHIISSADEKAKRYLTTIGKSAKDLGNLVDHLLVFSKMGKVALNRSRIVLSELVEDVRKRFMQVESNRSITWYIQPLPTIDGDMSMMRLIFENLLSNAIKYSRNVPAAIIQIGCQETKDEYVFSVIDNGAGFDPQYADKLFGVFQRLHSASEFEGTGIGLANVRRIVGRHNGRTWATGEVGKGAKFFFTLPKTE